MIKIDSLKLNVEFDFDNVMCTVTDSGRNISVDYKCFDESGIGICESVDDIGLDFNRFIGDCVTNFLQEEQYTIFDDEDY